MSETPKPDGIVPYLTVRDATAAIVFYEKAFGAVERMRMPTEDGKRLMHADLALNGGTLMLADEFPEHPGSTRAPGTDVPNSVVITMVVSDADAVFAKATAAGATVVMPLDNMFWGERFGQLKDPFGYKWSIRGPVKQ